MLSETNGIVRIHGQYSSGSFSPREAKILILFLINSFKTETRFLKKQCFPNTVQERRRSYKVDGHLLCIWPRPHLRVIILKLRLSYYAFCLTLRWNDLDYLMVRKGDWKTS